MPEIILKNITKRWGKFYAVDKLNLVIEDNSFITLLGPSGCGKTTTLRMIAGLETPTTGQIKIGERIVFDSEAGINIPANKRNVGFLFQNYALWPNMTVYQNVSFGLSNIKEEMFKYANDIKTLKEIISALEKPSKIVELANDCKDKDGKIDSIKACLKYIDYYTISLYTAKKIFNYKLHSLNNIEDEARALIEKLSSELNNKYEAYKKRGLDVDKDNILVKDGTKLKEVRKLEKEEVDLAVRRVSRIVKIGMFMDRYPAELSGGQQQRVAIARTLAPEPDVLFMDEPLSNLDAKLRLEMRYELQRLHVETGSTFVYVTHDQMEAMTLATKICLIDNGVLQQYEAPLMVYNNPNNLFIADFVGNPSINFIEAKGKQVNGLFELNLLENRRAVFKPNNEIEYNKWIEKRNVEIIEQQKYRSSQLSDRKYVEKGNKDERFKYHIARVNEDDYSLKEEPVITDEDFIVAVRPEFVGLNSEGKIDADIYGAMPTGMESTLKLRVGEFLLTSVVFGGKVFQLGAKVSIEFFGKEILLYDRKSAKLITAGTIEIL
jgi:ABC-type sugar transport system ATPase subunit